MAEMDDPEKARALGPAFERALGFAHRPHAEQTRKGPAGIPYAAHLLGVASLVLEAGGDEDQAVAALLHDAVGDQGDKVSLEEIRERFGPRVAGIVEGCTQGLDGEDPGWREKRSRYLSSLSGKDRDVLLVACGDKLYNARTILRDHRRHGDALWERFNASAEDTLLYYGGLVEGFRGSELKSWLVDELEWTVTALEGRVPS